MAAAHAPHAPHLLARPLLARILAAGFVALALALGASQTAALAAPAGADLVYGSVEVHRQLGSLSTSGTLSTAAVESSTAYKRLDAVIAAGESSVDFEREGLRVTLGEFEKARDALAERPEYSGLIASWSWTSYTTGQMVSVQIGYREDVTPALVKRVFAELPAGVDRALSWVSSDMTSLQKAQALHDYLVRNVAYDQRASSNTEPSVSHNPYGALCAGTAVCEGYARAYQMLLERVGLSCAYVESEAMVHGWNMVQLDGAWYHVDVTWDDPLISSDQGAAHDGGFNADVSYAFFLKGDSYMKAHEHFGWSAAHSAPASYELPPLPEYTGPASGGSSQPSEGSEGEGSTVNPGEPVKPALQEQLIAAPKTRTFTLKASKLKTKARSLAGWRCYAEGKLSYVRTGGSSKVSVNSKTGLVTVKKGTKRGTYKIRLKVTAAATSEYMAATERYTLTIRVV